MKRKLTPPRKLCAIIGMSLLFSTSFAQTQVDLGSIAKNNNSVKYVAIGSSLSAGVRDGGVYAEAQQTSFPALLAQQMGIKDFKQPLLPGNGTGRKTVTKDKNGNLKFTEVKGLDDKSPNAQLPKVVGEVDNLAVPYQKVLDIYESDEANVNQNFDNRSYKYLNRLSIDKQNISSYVKLKNGKMDFFTFELGLHDFIQHAEKGGFGTELFYMTEREFTGEKSLLDQLVKQCPNGVVLNIPNYLNFPAFKMYSYQKFKQNNQSVEIYIEHWQKTHVREANDEDIFLIRPSVLSMLNGNDVGLSKNNPLPDEDILDSDEIAFASPIGYNRMLKYFAETNKLAYVDLHSLYESLLDGTYRNDSGVKVDISYPNGNFFSSDGITPTALGQAIIANEVIRVVNEFYSSKIPQLNLQNYLNH